jgi:hypothetical protein
VYVVHPNAGRGDLHEVVRRSEIKVRHFVQVYSRFAFQFFEPAPYDPATDL